MTIDKLIIQKQKELIASLKDDIEYDDIEPHNVTKEIEKELSALYKQGEEEEIKDINFIKWYSGMEEQKIRNAYKRYLAEINPKIR